jgi:predicted dienelactone hydrolase
MTIPTPAPGRAVELTIWYPTHAKESREPIGESKIFKGTLAVRNALVAEGSYPVILMAHGGFRAALYQEGWMQPIWQLVGTL